ncbi:hypothetical protein [Streptomyces arenae]|uniref:hypothetical protein n=1 Tax=Streptomyces arenae TaxID=29301 RepID=UPI002659EBAA|nr:hypothetical protein [Streptomyces arenae]MCG7202928.1 hypothetical protein [Streptomyces arenae]
MAGEDGGGSVDEQFARLPRSARDALEESGLGLPQLRRMAAEEGGERRVRHILSEFAPSGSSGTAGWWEYGGDLDGRHRAPVWPWLRLLLVAVAAVALCLLSTYWLDRQALFVGGALALAVVWAGYRTRWSRGGFVVCGLVGAAYLALVWLGSYYAGEWYLHLRGQETTVTYAAPVHEQASHGVRVTYCRVRLPDGTVRRVFENDERCTDPDMAGTRLTAVIDPTDHYRPVLGRASDIGGTVQGWVCLGAAAVLVLAPLSAAALSRADERRGGRGGRSGRASGAAV